MSTQHSTIEYLIDQLQEAGDVRARKMFGEYALYCNEKVVALVCDDTLFVKITDVGTSFVGETYHAGTPYPGAKPYLEINEDQWEDREWLTRLITITAQALPDPQPRKKQLVGHDRSSRKQ